MQDSWKDLLIGEAAAAVIPLLADKQEQVASAAALSLQNLQNDDSLAALIPYVLEAKGTPLIMQARALIMHSPAFIMHSPAFITHSPTFIMHSPAFITHPPAFIMEERTAW